MLPKRRQCKIIIATSLVWLLIDFGLLLYYTSPCIGPGCSKETKEEPGAIQRIFEKANDWMNRRPEEKKQIGKSINEGRADLV